MCPSRNLLSPCTLTLIFIISWLKLMCIFSLELLQWSTLNSTGKNVLLYRGFKKSAHKSKGFVLNGHTQLLSPSKGARDCRRTGNCLHLISSNLWHRYVPYHCWQRKCNSYTSCWPQFPLCRQSLFRLCFAQLLVIHVADSARDPALCLSYRHKRRTHTLINCWSELGAGLFFNEYVELPTLRPSDSSLPYFQSDQWPSFSRSAALTAVEFLWEGGLPRKKWGHGPQPRTPESASAF